MVMSLPGSTYVGNVEEEKRHRLKTRVETATTQQTFTAEEARYIGYDISIDSELMYDPEDQSFYEIIKQDSDIQPATTTTEQEPYWGVTPVKYDPSLPVVGGINLPAVGYGKLPEKEGYTSEELKSTIESIFRGGTSGEELNIMKYLSPGSKIVDTPEARATAKQFIESYLSTPTEEEVDTAISTIFPENDVNLLDTSEAIAEIRTWAVEDPEQFIQDIASKGWSKEGEQIFRALGLDKEYVDQIYGWYDIVEELKPLADSADLGITDYNKSFKEFSTDPESLISLLKGKKYTPEREALLHTFISDITEEQIREVFYGHMDTGAFGKFTYNLAKGFANIPTTIGSVLDWIGSEIASSDTEEDIVFGGAFKTAGGKVSSFAQSDIEKHGLQFDIGKGYGWVFVRGLPLQALIMAASVGTGTVVSGAIGQVGGKVIGGAVAGTRVAKLGAYSRFVLQSVGVGVSQRAIEAPLEASNAFQQAISSGMSEDDALKASNKVFTKNLELAGLDIAQWAVMLLPFQKFKIITPRLINRGIVRYAGKGVGILGVTLTEAGEEYYQEIIQLQALGNDISTWAISKNLNDDEIRMVTVLGAMYGGVFSGSANIIASIQDITMKNLPEAVASDVRKDVAQMVREGMPLEQAVSILDKVIDNPEVQKVTEGAIKAANALYYANQINTDDQAMINALENKLKSDIKATGLKNVPEIFIGYSPLAEVSRRAKMTLEKPDIESLSSLLDEDNRSGSIKKIEKAISNLDPEQVVGIDEVQEAIEEYRNISKKGMTPEEYQEAKSDAWDAIVEAVDGLEVVEAGEVVAEEAPLTAGLQKEYTELINNAERIEPDNETVKKAKDILNKITPENQRNSLIQIEALEDELKSITKGVGVAEEPLDITTPTEETLPESVGTEEYISDDELRTMFDESTEPELSQLWKDIDVKYSEVKQKILELRAAKGQLTPDGKQAQPIDANNPITKSELQKALTSLGKSKKQVKQAIDTVYKRRLSSQKKAAKEKLATLKEKYQIVLMETNVAAKEKLATLKEKNQIVLMETKVAAKEKLATLKEKNQIVLMETKVAAKEKLETTRAEAKVEKQEAVFKEKLKAAGIEDLKTELADIVKTYLPIEQRGKLLKTVANVKTIKQFGSALERVENIQKGNIGKIIGGAAKRISNMITDELGKPMSDRDDMIKISKRMIELNPSNALIKMADRIPGLKQSLEFYKPKLKMDTPETRPIHVGMVADMRTRSYVFTISHKAVVNTKKSLVDAFGRNVVHAKEKADVLYIGPNEEYLQESTLLDICNNPDRYILSNEQQVAVNMLSDLFESGRQFINNGFIENKNHKIGKFAVKNGGAFLPNVDISEDALAILGSEHTAGMVGRAKERFYQTSLERSKHDEAIGRTFVPQMNVEALIDDMFSFYASRAARETFNKAVGGKTKLDIVKINNPLLYDDMVSFVDKLNNLQKSLETENVADADIIREFLGSPLESENMNQLLADLSSAVKDKINVDIANLKKRWDASNPKPFVLDKEYTYRYFLPEQLELLKYAKEISNNPVLKVMDITRRISFSADGSPITIQGSIAYLADFVNSVKAMSGEVKGIMNSRNPLYPFTQDAVMQTIANDPEGTLRFATLEGIPLGQTYSEFELSFLKRIPGFDKIDGINDAMFSWLRLRKYHLWKAKSNELVKSGVPQLDAEITAHAITNSIFPMADRTLEGQSQARAKLLRTLPTSYSFMMEPAKLMAEATQGYIKVITGQKLTPKENMSVRVMTTMAASTMFICAISAAFEAQRKGEDQLEAAWDAINPNPNNGKFLSLIIGNIRISLGGPYRGIFRALYPSKVEGISYPVPFAGIFDFFKNRMNPALRTQYDLTVNKDYSNRQILEGGLLENFMRLLFYEVEGISPLTIGQVIEDFRTDKEYRLLEDILSGLAGVNAFDMDDSYFKRMINELGNPDPDGKSGDIKDTQWLFGKIAKYATGELYKPDPITQSVIDTKAIKEEYESYLNKNLYQLNTDSDKGDTYEDYYTQGKITRRQYELIKQYNDLDIVADKDQFLIDHPEININPKEEYLRSHPDENAKLALWGQENVLTKKAYDKVMSMAQELDIPDNALVGLPPKNVAEPYFDYQDLLKDYSSGSSEALLFRLENEEFEKWGETEYKWTKPNNNINVLRINVKYREEDAAYNDFEKTANSTTQLKIEQEAYLIENPNYAEARIQRAGYKLNIPEEWIDTYVAYIESGYTKGTIQGDRWLFAHKDFYTAVRDIMGWGPLNTTGSGSSSYGSLPGMTWRR